MLWVSVLLQLAGILTSAFPLNHKIVLFCVFLFCHSRLFIKEQCCLSFCGLFSFFPKDIWKHPRLWVLLSWLYYKDTPPKVHLVMGQLRLKTKQYKKPKKTLLGKYLETNNEEKRLPLAYISISWKVPVRRSQGELVGFFHPRICVGVGIRSIENFRVLSHDFTIFILTLRSEKL